jgi:multimeric flavodoxin WrbA
MKTLVINGSPRLNGHTMTIVNEMLKHLDGEVQIVHVYNEQISPCTDCRHCWTSSECAIDDKMREYYQILDEVDNVVLASPIYFSELTSELLRFASRLQRFFVERSIKKTGGFKLKQKSGALIIAAGGDSRDLERRAIATANIIFRHMNVRSIGVVGTLDTNNISACEDVNALEGARDIAIKLNEKYRISY